MKEKQFKKEAHSYIVEFYRYLVKENPAQRIPFVLYWTSLSLEEAKHKLSTEKNHLLDYYGKGLLASAPQQMEAR
jgi:hypothetical protein